MFVSLTIYVANNTVLNSDDDLTRLKNLTVCFQTYCTDEDLACWYI